MQQVLRESEALTSIVGRLRVLDLDPDLALDVAMIPGRALDLWRNRLKEWRSDPTVRPPRERDVGESAHRAIELETAADQAVRTIKRLQPPQKQR